MQVAHVKDTMAVGNQKEWASNLLAENLFLIITSFLLSLLSQLSEPKILSQQGRNLEPKTHLHQQCTSPRPSCMRKRIQSFEPKTQLHKERNPEVGSQDAVVSGKEFSILTPRLCCVRKGIQCLKPKTFVSGRESSIWSQGLTCLRKGIQCTEPKTELCLERNPM